MVADFSFAEIIDTKQIKNILESFYKLNGIHSTLIGVEGNIMATADGEWVAAGWQDICLNFHRNHPETRKKCLESDTRLEGQLNDTGIYSCYQCLNGLVDAAIPINVDGNGHYVLQVKDDGVGLPDGLDIHKLDSLGVQLINSLVKQLDGEISIHGSEGTCFQIEFNQLKYKSRV